MGDERDPEKRRRGLWGTLGVLLRGPVDAFDPEGVRKGAHTIGLLTETIRSGPVPDRRVRVEEDGALDLPAMAFLAGRSEADVVQMLRNRRRQSKIAVYSYLMGGFGFLLIWVYEALLQPAYASLGYILALVAFCAVFFLAAFYNALINWQARTIRLGTAREFLTTTDSWWPL